MDPGELMERFLRTKARDTSVTQQEFECVASMWNDGYSVSQIAQALNRGNKFVINRLAELDIDRCRAKLQYGRSLCMICAESYVKRSMRQKLCETCIPDKHAQNIWGRYRLTRPQLREMYDLQGGRCGLCPQALVLTYDPTKPHVVVDHDHETGRIRGLLCSKCNWTLGIVESCRRNPEWVKRANAYLDKDRENGSH